MNPNREALRLALRTQSYNGKPIRPQGTYLLPDEDGWKGCPIGLVGMMFRELDCGLGVYYKANATAFAGPSVFGLTESQYSCMIDRMQILFEGWGKDERPHSFGEVADWLDQFWAECDTATTH